MKVHIAPPKKQKNKIIIKKNKNEKAKERRGRFGTVVDLGEWWVGCMFIFCGIYESSVVVPVKPKVKKERDLYGRHNQRNKLKKERERERETPLGST